MADILNIGSSALLALQQAMSTTGQNIANVNTEGYSRQRVELDTLPPQLAGGSYIGSGVTLDSVTRIFDQFLVDEVRSRTSSSSSYDSFYSLSSRLDGILADPAVGLTSSLNSFFSAVQDVANNPASATERQVLLGEAETLADRFHYLSATVNDLNAEVNARIETTVADINGYARGIAELNDQIVRATAASGGNPPNDLLDARDQLVNQLAEKISVTTVSQSNGALNVMVGKGQPLVIGATAEQIQTFSSPYDASRTEVGIANAAGQFVDIGRFISGGELLGVLDFRAKVLDPALNQLGLVAVSLTETFNAQHQLGMDLQGQIGGAFFNSLAPTVSQDPTNTGSAVAAVTIDDVTAMTGHDYKLRYDGSNWSLTDLTTGASQSGSGPFVVDGLSISVTGAPANGDNFLIQPTRQAAAGFDVAITSTQQIAAAAPVIGQQDTANLGDGVLSALTVSDAASLPLATPVVLTYNPDALGAGVPGYDVSGIAGGPLAYDPATESAGKTFTLGGMDFTLNGQPQAGDSFTIANNTSGTGDNRNALLLAGLQNAKQLNNGVSSYQDVYSSMVSDVAVKTRQAQSGSETEGILLNQAVDARESVSGVNLDEEAADLIRYQQAYQAAAQVIAVADQMFQVLLDATRR